MVPEKTVQAVREKAELLNGGASLGGRGDALAAIAAERALAYCQRRDVPEDMEQAVAVLALALYWAVPQGGNGSVEEDPAEDGSGKDTGGGSGGNAAGSSPAMDWEALLASGAVKSVQRGDTAITFSAGGSAAASALVSQSAARPTEAAALAGLAPWRRLGRLDSFSRVKAEPGAPGRPGEGGSV